MENEEWRIENWGGGGNGQDVRCPSGGELSTGFAPTVKKAEGKKRTSPKTPKEKKRRVKKDRRGFSKKPSFARAGARVRAGHAGRVTLPARRIARALDADRELAVAAFGGTAEDRRIWAAIAWRVGVDEFHYALMDKFSEDAADGAPKCPATAFQAFLNRRFPKDKPQNENLVRNNSCPLDATGHIPSGSAGRLALPAAKGGAA